MAWVEPRTWVAGELVTEAVLNEQLRDNLNVLKTSIDSNGKLTALSSTYVADLSGSDVTGLVYLGSANTFTVGNQDFNGGSTARLVIPCGADLWAT
jgi:hypothetical protein